MKAARTPTRIGFACLLALVLLVLSLGRVLLDLGSTAFDVQIVASALEAPLWRNRLGMNIALFGFALLALHLGFGLTCWLLAIIGEIAFPKAGWSRRQWILVWFLIGAVWLLLANAASFPHSSLGEPYQVVAAGQLIGIRLHILLASCGLVVVTGIFALALLRSASWRKGTGVVAGVAALAVATGFSWKVATGENTAQTRPNVILLGIDSLRPDAINARDTPNLHAFIAGSVQLADTTTPLARTFPSWTSVLTGRDPHTTGAYMNLMPRDLIHTGATLPDALREQGYLTAYAIDETRFSNIDRSYGFDQTIAPIEGASDFVLARFADTPLSNLVVNTWLGALLFPHVHTNRAAHVVYDPDSFVRRIGRELEAGGPLFLAAHLTLPHWPYTWASSPGKAMSEDTAGEIYRDAIHRADRQFGDLLELLERRGILDDAVVVALSDHGEALGQADDFMADVFPDKDPARVRMQRWGHGTSVLSPHQFRVVLAFRAYGRSAALLGGPAIRQEPVSLVDVAPTILDLVRLPPLKEVDGQSLAPLLLFDSASPGEFLDRIRFTETEYNPQGFSPTDMTRSALAEAVKVYRLDPQTDRIEVRRDKLEWIRTNRQYAALVGNRAMGAAVPGLREDGRYEFIYVPLTRPRPQDGDHRDPETEATDSRRLRQELSERFGIDIADPT